MTVKVTKPALNLREELSSLKKPSGVAGEAMLRAETPQEQQELLGVGRKNILINGAMLIAQRGNGPVTVADGSNEGYSTLDRWLLNYGSAQGGAVSFERAAINDDKVSYALKVACTTAYPTLSSSHNFTIEQRVEINNIRPLIYDQQDAVLSFLVRTNKGGKYGINLFINAATDVTWGTTYTLKGDSSWERVEIRIPKNSVSFSSAEYCGIRWMLSAGTARVSSSTAVWATYGGGGALIPEAINNFFDSTSNTFELANVQLELGSVATPFEHRSYGEELALCSRYYQLVDMSRQHGFYRTNNTFDAGNIYFHTPMRANPTLIGVVSGVIVWSEPGNNVYSASSNTGLFLSNTTQYGTGITHTRQSGGLTPTNYNIYICEGTITLAFDAEL